MGVCTGVSSRVPGGEPGGVSEDTRPLLLGSDSRPREGTCVCVHTGRQVPGGNVNVNRGTRLRDLPCQAQAGEETPLGVTRPFSRETC